MSDLDTGDETRPDGHTSSPETLRLRAATRALRLHLDKLPAAFHFNGPGDQFFTELAFPFVCQRYSCAESLIGVGFGGTVISSLARSLENSDVSCPIPDEKKLLDQFLAKPITTRNVALGLLIVAIASGPLRTVLRSAELESEHQFGAELRLHSGVDRSVGIRRAAFADGAHL
jgi:hypothetical protein